MKRSEEASYTIVQHMKIKILLECVFLTN
jgi:hypothetical protein